MQIYLSAAFDIGLTIRAFSIGSALWVLEVLCCLCFTQSGRKGKMVASHAAVAHSIPAEVVLIYTMHEPLRGYCP